MQDGRKAVWSSPYVSMTSFLSLKQNFITYGSSKVSSHPHCIFEIHQLWQSGFNKLYSNCCCSCSFEAEIIKINQSSRKMYSNKYTEFSRVYNNSKFLNKKVWKLFECTTYTYIHIYITCIFIYIHRYSWIYIYIYIYVSIITVYGGHYLTWLVCGRPIAV